VETISHLPFARCRAGDSSRPPQLGDLAIRLDHSQRDRSPDLLDLGRKELLRGNAIGFNKRSRLSCAWHVLGLEMPLHDWARLRRWSDGKPMVPAAAEPLFTASVETVPGRQYWRDAAE
jgi:hypothetical protein